MTDCTDHGVLRWCLSSGNNGCRTVSLTVRACAAALWKESNFALRGAFQHGIEGRQGKIAGHAHAGGQLGQIFHGVARPHVQGLDVGLELVAVAGQQAQRSRVGADQPWQSQNVCLFRGHNHAHARQISKNLGIAG